MEAHTRVNMHSDSCCFGLQNWWWMAGSETPFLSTAAWGPIMSFSSCYILTFTWEIVGFCRVINLIQCDKKKHEVMISCQQDIRQPQCNYYGYFGKTYGKRHPGSSFSPNLEEKHWVQLSYIFWVRRWKAQFTVWLDVITGWKMIMSGLAGCEVALSDGTLSIGSGSSDDCKHSEGFSNCRVH